MRSKVPERELISEANWAIANSEMAMRDLALVRDHDFSVGSMTVGSLTENFLTCAVVELTRKLLGQPQRGKGGLTHPPFPVGLRFARRQWMAFGTSEDANFENRTPVKDQADQEGKSGPA